MSSSYEPLSLGASPRERRNLGWIHSCEERARRISARAEEPNTISSRLWGIWAHLRASGGTHRRNHFTRIETGASPRERRNHGANDRHEHTVRRISARAEEPLTSTERRECGKAHLRASGGTAQRSACIYRSGGASPRERRNLESAALLRRS